jgi:hypothetical protein
LACLFRNRQVCHPGAYRSWKFDINHLRIQPAIVNDAMLVVILLSEIVESFHPVTDRLGQNVQIEQH